MTSLPDLIARLKIEVSHYKDCSGDIPLNVDVEDIERLLEAAERADAVDRLFAGMADPQKEIADLRSKLAKSQEETAAIVNSTLKELDETRAKLAQREAYIAEIRSYLRQACIDLDADNSWSDNLHLGDAIEKRLARPVYAELLTLRAQRDQLARDAERARGRKVVLPDRYSRAEVYRGDDISYMQSQDVLAILAGLGVEAQS